jgi:predicted HAD superfamily Cof-like phosphohydrolase
MSLDWTDDVLSFHRKFGCAIGARPGVPDEAVKRLRIALIREETAELLAALERDDLVEITDGGLDLVYVVLGTLIAYGVNPRGPWNEIHRSNMSKSGGGERADGKVLKPRGWRPPDIAGSLRMQRPLRRDRAVDPSWETDRGVTTTDLDDVS